MPEENNSFAGQNDSNIRDGMTAVFKTVGLTISEYTNELYYNIVYLEDGSNKKHSLMLPTPTSIETMITTEGWDKQDEQIMASKEKFIEKIKDCLEDELTKISESNLKLEFYVKFGKNLENVGPKTVYVDGLNNYVTRTLERVNLDKIYQNAINNRGRASR